MSRIADVVHDNPFCLSQLRWQPTERILCLFCGTHARDTERIRWYHLLCSQWVVPLKECALEVCEVRSYSIDDPAEIDCYTFADIRYNQPDPIVSILTCEGLRIDAHVDALHLRVRSTGRPFGTRRVRYFLSAEITLGPRVRGQ